MIPAFPFFGFPMHYNSYRNSYYNNLKTTTDNYSNYSNKDTFVSNSASSSSEQFFDIFGIHLYFDDILILCLLFFLYQEEVNDQLLFIALLLLLLS